MTKSPGHQKYPDHTVREERVGQRMRVQVGGQTLADSADVIKVTEDDQPVRYYFPRADVAMEKLRRTDTTTECPFKGTARYFSVTANGRTLVDTVWSYEDPYEEHAGLKDRLAFDADDNPEIEVEIGARA